MSAFGPSVRSAAALGNQEWLHVADPRGRLHDRRAGGRERGRPPLPGLVALGHRERAEAPVIGSCGEHRRGGRLANLDPTRFSRAVVDRVERGPELGVQGRLLPREQRNEHVVGRGRDRGGCGVARIGRGRRAQVRLVASLDRVDRIVDGALDHRQVEVGDGRALAGRADDRCLGVVVPINHNIRGLGRGRARLLCLRHRAEHPDPQRRDRQHCQHLCCPHFGPPSSRGVGPPNESRLRCLFDGQKPPTRRYTLGTHGPGWAWSRRAKREPSA